MHDDSPSVLTLVAQNLSVDRVDERAAALRALGAKITERRWLAETRACDLYFTALPSTAAAWGGAEAAPWQVEEGVDWLVQPLAERRVALLVADLESTVIHNEMLDELASAIGRRHEMETITALAMNDEMDFETALRRRVAWLKGMPLEELQRAAQSIVIDAGAAALVATLRHLGVRTVLASGGFTYFAEPIAQRLGFDAVSANVLEIAAGRLTGRVVPPILDRQSKVQILEQHCRELGISPSQTMAVGDGANDLPMLLKAGLGVAFHGKPKVAASAPANIRYGRLDTLLFFLGVAEEAWQTGIDLGEVEQVR